MTARRVAIHYHRPPDRMRVYDQRIVHEQDDVIVTLSEPIDVDEPMRHDGNVMLERGSLAVWFTFPGLWHDIGRFHRADGTFTGLYANILTPPRIEGEIWRTTDLFLDVWQPRDGSPVLLDEDEFEEACRSGWVDGGEADRARVEAERILERAMRQVWPPACVDEWTLSRALEQLGD